MKLRFSESYRRDQGAGADGWFFRGHEDTHRYHRRRRQGLDGHRPAGYLHQVPSRESAVRRTVQRAIQVPIISGVGMTAASHLGQKTREFKVLFETGQLRRSDLEKFLEVSGDASEIEVRCSDELEMESYPGAFSQIVTNPVMNTLLHAFNEGEESTGLGLYILYNLVTQKLAGTVSCHSSPGRGALFTIRFPNEIRGEST